MSDFARMLTQVRKDAGLNQKQAARELGISQALLSHYENGVREPKFEFILHVCRYYGVSADYLLGRVNEQEPELAFERAVRTCGAMKAVLAMAEGSEALTNALADYLDAAADGAGRILQGFREAADPDAAVMAAAEAKLIRTAAETKSRLICSEETLRAKYPTACEAYRNAGAEVAALRAELTRLLGGAGKEERP